eukprot:5172787-Amphidinium_carterae.1
MAEDDQRGKVHGTKSGLQATTSQSYRGKVEYKQNHFHASLRRARTWMTTTAGYYAVKTTIEIYTQARHRQVENNPPQHNRFFLFLEHTRPNRRTVQAIRTTQTPEKQQRDLQRIPQLPEMQSVKRTFSIPEGQIETEENLDDLEARSTTRASGSTSFKRKSTEEEPQTKKHQASTIFNFYNATINTHSLIPMSTSPTMTPRKKDDSTVQSTPRTT